MNTDPVQQSFEQLYEVQSDAIFRFILIRVSDRERALDLTQETFTRLWQALLDGKEMSNARAFLYTIAHNLIIDWYRKKKAVSLEAMNDPETGETYEPLQEGAIKDLELGAEGRFLIDAIKRLPPSYRDPIQLRFVEGMSPPEIGKALGISTNAASVRLTRGVEELRKITGYEIDQ
jgi:RNA polymerase sigma-70 factor (ECF subfamily)